MSTLQILHISSYDLMGSRFNGFEWHEKLLGLSCETRMLVSNKQTTKFDWIDRISPNLPSQFSKLNQIRRLSGKHNGPLIDNSKDIFKHPWYLSADVVHLQIVLDGTLSIETIERIQKEKPTVWTWHDPSPITGHCVTPMDCFRWLSDCKGCPDLARPFAVVKDFCNENLIRKAELFNDRMTVHVASKWMKNLVESHPLSKNLNMNQIPFGLDLSLFSRLESTRSNLAIPNDAFVIGIRATSDPYKSFDFFVQAIQRIQTNKLIYIVTIGEIGLIPENILPANVALIEIPWTYEANELLKFYNNLDLFISPSRFESFGLMGLEAMACGVPVAGIENSAVDEVCRLQNFGIRVKPNDINNFAKLIDDFVLNYSKTNSEGIQQCVLDREKMRKFVIENYDLDSYLEKLIAMYKDSIITFGEE
jgi:glycosyltransferase involved in cell wall biosynthesis